MTVGIAVPTTVASRAAMAIPVITPITTAQRRRVDISNTGIPTTNPGSCKFASTVLELFSRLPRQSVLFPTKRFLVLLPKFGDLCHKVIGDLLMRSKAVGPLVKIGQVNLFAKPDPDLFSASPVSHDLLGQIVPKP